jgi:hypothetical protein
MDNRRSEKLIIEDLKTENRRSEKLIIGDLKS